MDVVDQLGSLKEGKLSRRKFTKTLLAAGIGVATTPLASRVATAAAGIVVGTVTLTLDGETVFHAPVVALVPVEEGGLFKRLWDMILMWIAGLFRA